MVKSRPQRGHWTEDEHRRFQVAFEKHRNNWQAVSVEVRTRSPIQCRSHAQKLQKKQPLALQPCVFPEDPSWTEGNGPVRAFSQGSQYGESVRLTSALEEEDWEALSEAQRLSLPRNPYSTQSAPPSMYSIANSAETSLQLLSPRKVRTVGVQYVKMASKVYQQEHWRALVHWMKNSKNNC